jgi:peptide/nickel transport system ATP-binding protein
MTTGFLAVEGLRLETGDGAVLDGVDLSLGQGEALAVVGASGSGKTTLALALLGHLRDGIRHTGGRVRVRGADVLPRPPAGVRGALLGYVGQDPGAALNSYARIRTTLLTATGRVPRGKRNVTVRRLLERVGLPGDADFARRYPHQLSGGQQQRVVLASALARDPAVLVLDEPTTALDPLAKAEVVRELRALRERGIGMVWISHDLTAARGFADRVVVLDGGRVAEEGPAERVLTAPESAAGRRLVAATRSAGDAATGFAATGRQASAAPSGLVAQFPAPPRGATEPQRASPDLLSGTDPGPGPSAEPVGPGPRPGDGRPTDDSRRAEPRTAFPETGAPATVAARENGHPVPQANAPNSVQATNGPVLQASGLVARHGATTVLHGVDLTVQQGECLAVLGVSGVGKSTLARCLTGLHPVAGGTVTLRGAPLARDVRRRSRPERAALGLVAQNPAEALHPRQDVRTALVRPLKRLCRVTDRAELDVHVRELLESVHLPTELASRLPGELSGGQRQRVALARALAGRPAVLVCDEVTSALDTVAQEGVLRLLAELRDRTGLAVVLITHDARVAQTASDRVLVLADGQVAATGPTDVLLSPGTDPEEQAARLLTATTSTTEPTPYDTDRRRGASLV